MGSQHGTGNLFGGMEELHRPDCEGKITYGGVLIGRRLGWVWGRNFGAEHPCGQSGF